MARYWTDAVTACKFINNSSRFFSSHTISHLLKTMSTYASGKHGLKRQVVDNMEIFFSVEIKQKFFKAVAVSVLLYGCTNKKHSEKAKEKYTRRLHSVPNTSWKQHFTK